MRHTATPTPIRQHVTSAAGSVRMHCRASSATPEWQSDARRSTLVQRSGRDGSRTGAAFESRWGAATPSSAGVCREVSTLMRLHLDGHEANVRVMVPAGSELPVVRGFSWAGPDDG